MTPVAAPFTPAVNERSNLSTSGENAAVSRAARVAFVGQAGASAGGAERTLAIFLAFAPADIEASAILFEDGAFADELRRLGVPVEIVVAPHSVAASSRERLRVSALFDTIVHAARVARLLRELRADVAYSNTMKAHFVCGIAARMVGIPCIMHFHDIVDGMMRHAVRIIARFGSVQRVACSRLVATAFGLDRTVVSYGPIVLTDYDNLPQRNDARERLGLPTEKPIVALVGRINRWKGHDRFLRIAAAVNRVKPVHFVIVGAPIFRDADFVPELERLVEQLGIGEHVSFVPWVDDVRLVYAAIDLNVNCSTREPLGRSIIEAAAAGIPSVCFDDSGAAETLTDSRIGRVVPAGNEPAFAQAILDYLSMPDLANVRPVVRQSAMRFDARLIAIQLADVVRLANRSSKLPGSTKAA